MVNLLRLRVDSLKADARFIALKLEPREINGGTEVVLTYYRRYNGIYATQNVEIWVVRGAREEDFLSDAYEAYQITNAISSSVTRTISILSLRRRWRRW